MRNRTSIGHVKSQRHSTNVRHTGRELSQNAIRGNGHNRSIKDGTGRIDTDDFHTILERSDVQFLKESSSTVVNRRVLGTDQEILNDFNLSLVDLSRDLKGMEERNLRGVKASGTTRDNHIALRDHTYLSSSLHSVRFNDGLQLKGSLIREDKT
jgi:hypothetical protein